MPKTVTVPATTTTLITWFITTRWIKTPPPRMGTNEGTARSGLGDGFDAVLGHEVGQSW